MNKSSDALDGQMIRTEQTPPLSSWPDVQAQAQEGEPLFDPFHIFVNPFTIDDIMVFDDPTLRRLLHDELFPLSIKDLVICFRTAPTWLLEHIQSVLLPEEQRLFQILLRSPLKDDGIEAIRQQLLDHLFWELIYWKRPDLYDELTAGEHLHSGMLKSLEADIRDRVILDAASGSGRMTLECLTLGSRQVYAVDPSPAALRVLDHKVAHLPSNRVKTLQGCFERLPLKNCSIDTSISCSAFRANEASLAEFLRVTRPEGKIVLIWPNPEDYNWLAERGFQYVSFPVDPDACVHFRSLETAMRCVQLFYASNQAAINCLLATRQPKIPYKVLGFKQPSDYCWRRV